MARFNLQKDEAVALSTVRRSFNLEKEEELNRIRVDLTWEGADLDAQAFCLDKNDQIIDDFDFVFYNSERRTVLPTPGESDNSYMGRIVEVPFDKAQFGTKPNWRKQTAPLSTDSSVIGSFDDRSGGDGETIRVDLSKVRPGIETILFTVTVHGDDTFADVRNAEIIFSNIDTNDELASFNLSQNYGSQTALVAAALRINDEGEWEFKAIGEAYDGGLNTLVETYAS